jgi:site-specific DNA-methyltransferase (adenine-specific)
MNNIKIICGDVIKVVKDLQEKSVDIVCSSPPYNLKIKYRKYKDNKKYDNYLQWMKDIFIALNRVLKDDGSFFLNIGSTNLNPWISFDVANIARELFILQNNFVWIKSITVNNESFGHFKPINSKRFVNHTFENIFHFTKTGEVRIDKLSIGVPYKDKSNILRWKGKKDKRCRGDCWHIPYDTINSKKDKFNHPAIFPVELATMCIKLHGIKEDILVLDPFMGIGSTLVAAQNLKINAIGIDIDMNYIKSAKKRLRNENIRHNSIIL